MVAELESRRHDVRVRRVAHHPVEVDDAVEACAALDPVVHRVAIRRHLGRPGGVRAGNDRRADDLHVLGVNAIDDLDHPVDELVGVSCRNEGVEHDRHALQLARRQRDGGVHPIEQGTAVHPRRFPLGIPVWSDMEVERLAEARHYLRQAGRGVGLGGHRPRRADHELERRLYLGAHVLGRPEVGAVKDGPQHFPHVTARALPRRDGVVHASVRRIIVHESLAQFAAHMVHRGGVVGQELEQADAFVYAVARRKPYTQHLFFPRVMGPVVELEPPSLLGTLDAPAREDARDVDHILLGIAAVHAQRVELEQLAGVVLVDPLCHALEGAPAYRILPGRVPHRSEQPRSAAEEGPGADAERRGRGGARRHALPIVEVEQHRGTLGGGDEEILELAHRAGANGVLDVVGCEEAIGALGEVDVEVIGPEVYHDLEQLPLGERRPDDRQVGEFACEAPAPLGDRIRLGLVGHRVGHGGQLALPPLALRLGIQRGEVPAVILQDVKPALPLSPTVVIDPIGRELAVDPAHYALGDHPRHVAGSGPVGEAVQGVERRVLRGEGGSGRRGS